MKNDERMKYKQNKKKTKICRLIVVSDEGISEEKQRAEYQRNTWRITVRETNNNASDVKNNVKKRENKGTRVTKRNVFVPNGHSIKYGAYRNCGCSNQISG